MLNYNGDILNGKSELYKRKQRENKEILLVAGITENIAENICFLAKIRHDYHSDCDILFMNKEHIKELKNFLKSVNENIRFIVPAISELVIDKMAHNKLFINTTNDIYVFRDCIEKFNYSVKEWLSTEIDSKLGTTFITGDFKRPLNADREMNFAIKDNKKLTQKTKRMNPHSDIDNRYHIFHTNFLLKDKSCFILKKEDVDKILKIYSPNSHISNIPSDLSFFNSDDLWNIAKSDEDKIDEDAKENFILARYYAALEMSNMINDIIPRIIGCLVRNYKLRRDVYFLFYLLAFVLVKTDCVRCRSSIDEINDIILFLKFDVKNIRGINHGLLYRATFEHNIEATFWYTINLAAAVKMSSKFFIDTCVQQKWNGKSMGNTEEDIMKKLEICIGKLGKRLPCFDFCSMYDTAKCPAECIFS